MADDPRGRSGLVSGTDVMEPGPGAGLLAFPIAVPIEGYPAGVFDLGDAHPAVATTDTDGSQLVVRLWRGGETTAFVTAGEDLGNTFFSVSMARAEGRTYLRAAAGDRGGGVFFAWDVDDPCRVLPAPTPGEDPGRTDPALPADASRGTATYTG